MTNIHPGAIEEVYKCASINLSPNTIGQVALSCLVNPPKPGTWWRARWRGVVWRGGAWRGGAWAS